MSENVRLPKGWCAERMELFITDMSGKHRVFSYVPALITNGKLNPETTTIPVAKCEQCHMLCDPSPESLRLHAAKHVFLKIPFDAPVLKY